MAHEEKPTTVCVLDASTYVGFWILKRLLNKGYFVHAAIQKNGKTSLLSFSFFVLDFPGTSVNTLLAEQILNCCRREGDREAD